ncbi:MULTISPECIES: antitoxin MazE family protein [Xanthomonas]|uniref:antitoxin MazE family protein n=1 Tax=Xanthomonas TaxID=338 RepID=UPI0029588098|nr:MULTISPECIES: antitoxin MazE family protein [Xanthomonas]WVK06397.1 antitoxin MazE family protein [Xanthomonas campestris pv. olitorii]
MQCKEPIMPRTHNPTNKVTRHRDRLRAAGYRPVQFWVHDTRSPELAAMLSRQCRSLHGDPTETDAIGFGEAAAGLIEGWE